jgi:uncharacterized small protein (DUF1192 family)
MKKLKGVAQRAALERSTSARPGLAWFTVCLPSQAGVPGERTAAPRTYRFSLHPAIVVSEDFEESIMNDGPSLSLAELDRRIAIARDNIRQLIEQAAAFSGAGDESRNADRIARQTEELEKLLKQRDALQKK